MDQGLINGFDHGGINEASFGIPLSNTNNTSRLLKILVLL
jgi:hypothetical protein